MNTMILAFQRFLFWLYMSLPMPLASLFMWVLRRLGLMARVELAFYEADGELIMRLERRPK